MALDKITYAAAKKYVDKSIAGGGISAGKNCTIDNISPITGGNRVTFKWTLDDGTVQTNYMDVMDGDKGETGDDGLGIKAVNINTQNHLIITFDDDTTYDAGELPGGSGEVISVNGKKGVVTLDANDVGALPDDTELFSGDYNDLDNLPDLTNFITNTVDNLVNYYKKTETYTKTEVDGIVEAIKNGRFEVVFTLPTTDIKTNVIYLVPKPTTQTSNIKDEYINLDGTSAGWEKIGDTEIDLSGYVTTTALNTALANYTTTTDLTTLLASKVDKVTGKGLSTNDYTNTDKELVDSIPNLAPISLVKDTVGWTGKNQFNVNTVRELPTNVVLNKTDTGIQIRNTVAATWRYASFWITHLLKNTDYIISCNVLITSGKGKILVKDSETQTSIFDVNVEDGETFTMKFNTGNYNSLYLTMYCTTDTAELGDVTYNNLMLRKANIADSTYEPYHESVETMYEEEIHGVNLFDDSKIEVGKAWNGDTNANRARNIIPCEPNSEYIISMNGTNGLDGVFFSVSASIPPASQTIITSFPYTIRTGTSDRYITLGFNKTNIALSDVTALKIMLRKATTEDSTYRPYNEQAIQNQLNAQGVLGAKNLWVPNRATGSGSGLTWTSDEDGIITVTGQNTGQDSYYIRILDRILLPKGTYIFSGCPANSNSLDISLFVRLYSGTQAIWGQDYGDSPKVMTLTEDTDVMGFIRVGKGVNVGTQVFKPMITLASDARSNYANFRPYAMTNKELTEKVKDTDLTEVSSLLDSTYVSSCGSFRYKVRNGICFVYINNIKFTSAAIDLVDFVILSEGVLPRGLIPASSMLWNKTVPPLLLGLIRNNDGDIKVTVNGVNSDNVNLSWYAASFSYPVI